MFELDKMTFRDATVLRQESFHIIYGDYVFTVSEDAFTPGKLSVWLSKRGIARASYCFSGTRANIAGELKYHLGDQARRNSYISMFESPMSNS